jgi:heat shock protein HslJ
VTARTPEQPPTLGDTEWTLVELESDAADVAEGERAPHLVLDLEESLVTGSTGINRLMGSFALSESELRFGPLASTRMAGSDDAMARERAFLDAMARVTSYELEYRTLSLCAGEVVVGRFRS